ncbi:hypothetical protein N431DRAFT_346691 [Stipitochalara longipes BDJ]|nr:hypothetical protein N431DRAFT_346691 [Stipitochalara longipes BDJ]
MGRPTEDELERILRDNYLSWENDPTGRDRHSTIIAEYNVKHEEVKNKRDGTIIKAETKYKNDLGKLEKDRDEKLDQLKKEVAPKLEKRKNWGSAFRELEALRKARGVGPPSVKAFAPSYHGINATSPPLPFHPRSLDNMSVASSSNTVPLSSGLKRKAAVTPLPSSFTDPPSLRLRNMDDPFIDTPRGPSTEMVVESKSIKNQLVDNSYIFLAANNIWLQRGGLNRMKTMIEDDHFSPKHVRADQTGYFIVFESSVQGDSQAALCFEHFQGKPFNRVPMQLELHRRDRRDR